MMERKTQVVLISHSLPVIHGQALAASTLLQVAENWSDIELHHVNTVYARTRGNLGKKNPLKVLKFLAYVIQSVVKIHRSHAQIAIVTPAFFRGPFLKDALMIWVLKALTSVKIVAWVHMDPSRLNWETAPSWFQKFATKTLAKIDLFVGCGDALIQQWPAFLPKNKSMAAANGIRVPGIARVSRSTARAKIIYLSAMHVEKGWLDAFAAAEAVCAKREKVEFHFYGNAYSEAEANEITARFNQGAYPEKIQWHGEVHGNDSFEALSAHDLYLFPSHTEQFPIAVLEAISMGLPVIAADVGAVSDAVVEGKGGWLVAPKSVEDLTKILLNALEHQDQWQKMGEWNRTHFSENFTHITFSQKWHNLLLKL